MLWVYAYRVTHSHRLSLKRGMRERNLDGKTTGEVNGLLPRIYSVVFYTIYSVVVTEILYIISIGLVRVSLLVEVNLLL